MTDTAFNRGAAEDFLYHEAALLDGWKLQDWAELFTDQGSYRVPSPDRPTGQPQSSLYLIADNRARIDERVRQLLGSTAWAENPRSRTRHLITNVRVQPQQDGNVTVLSNFVVYRFRHHEVHQYVGETTHLLDVRSPNEPRIVSKTVVLDLESLRDVGKVSIIL